VVTPALAKDHHRSPGAATQKLWNEVFLDLDPERGISAGERWERALNEAASRCEVVLFLISQSWLASRWCLKEFNLARKLNKRLFGLLIEAIPIVELPADLSGAWQVVDLASGQDHAMFRVVLPRTHEEAHVTFSKEGLARLRNGLAKAGLDPRFFAWPPERDPDRPPYRGLKPLEAEDAGIFFGRDAPIVEALDTLRGLRDGAAPRLLVILGASGAGKSSFLRAGLPRSGISQRRRKTGRKMARGCVFRGAAARLAAGKSGAVFRLLWPIPELSRRSASGGGPQQELGTPVLAPRGKLTSTRHRPAMAASLCPS
jgi:hypothetical protein